MKSNNTHKTKRIPVLWFSSIFACKLRETIISVLTGCSSQTLTEQSRCRERAACALISRWSGCTNDHRDSLKFVQEVARFVTSRFFGLKVTRGSEKTKSLNWQHSASLLLTSLSVWLQQHTHFQTYTHVQEYLDHGQSEGGDRPSLSLIGLDHDMSLMCVCCWTTGRLSELQRLFFPLERLWSHQCGLRFFLVASLRH